MLALSALMAVMVGCRPQLPKPTRIGVVLYGDSRRPQVDGFIKGMQRLGYRTNQSVVYLVRNAHHDGSKLPKLVRELLAAKVDLLVAAGGLEADAIKGLAAPRRIPVVVLSVNSIVERGLVRSRRHPGWDVTGVDNLNAEISGKRVELLQALVPGIHRILVLYYPDIAPSRIGMETARDAAIGHGLIIDARAMHSRHDIRRVMDKLKPGEDDAMLTVPAAPIDNALKDIILPQAQRLNLPLMTHARALAEQGALASYGAPLSDLGAQAARLAQKILDGVVPANIPFETPKKFVYTINREEMVRLHLKLSALAQTQVDEFITTQR